jgi:hypothetical protein
MQALREKESEAYRMTWNTKLFAPEDVVEVAREALMGRSMVNRTSTAASEKFDTPGPRWGEEFAKGSDPDQSRYAARVESRMWNGGGMTLVLSPLGRLAMIKIKAACIVKLRSGEERMIPLCIELAHNAVAEFGLEMPAVQGNLMGSFFVKEWEANYRNAELARVLNTIDPRIGVKVDGKKVGTGSGYLLQVKALGEEARVNAFRKKLLAGVMLEWRGEQKMFEIGSQMDVELCRMKKQKSAAVFKVQHDEATAGRQLTLRNLETDVASDERANDLLVMAESFMVEGGQLAEFVCKAAQSGRSAYAWITYGTEEEAQAALRKDALRELLIEHGSMAWRNDPIVELKGGLAKPQDGVLAGADGEQVQAKWYAPKKELGAGKEVQVIDLNDPFAAVVAACKGGNVEAMFKQMVVSTVEAAVDPFFERVKNVVASLEEETAANSEWKRQVEDDLREQREHTEELLQLVRQLVPSKKSKSSAKARNLKRKTPAAQPSDDDNMDTSEDEEEEEPRATRAKRGNDSVRKPASARSRTGDMDLQGMTLLKSLVAGLKNKDPEVAERLLVSAGLDLGSSEGRRMLSELMK